MLRLTDQLSLPESELSYRTSRSSGPGGQNVNKVETRVTVLFDVGASPTLSDEQKTKIRKRLATRIDKKDVLRVISQKHRSQGANRETARERLAILVADALEERRPRQRTREPAAAKRRRLEDKRRRGEVKRLRKAPLD
jgi:ribosome-associated protein